MNLSWKDLFLGHSAGSLGETPALLILLGGLFLLATRILGLAFLRHSETPGLGGRITEDWFLEQFRGLPLRPAKRGESFFTLKPAGTGIC